MKYRKEKDFLGEKNILNNCYWGIHTQRALENFKISKLVTPNLLVKSIAMVKKAACVANSELGYIEKTKSQAIILACEEIIQGNFDDYFILDALQGGAGTSTNMNVNEVIANRAIEILGGAKGDYKIVNPTEDVNKHQSTNDVYPTALKIALLFQISILSDAIGTLQGVLQKKEKDFSEIIKIGRTQLQHAVPITLGAQFSSFAEAIARDRWRTFKCQERLKLTNIGATAVGTGLGAPRKYIFLVIEKLREITNLNICRGENTMDQTSNADVFVETAGIIKAHASNLFKISNDLRLMASFEEIILPKLQVGSSIMPGKINPVILESAMQAAMKVISNDYLITQAASQGSLQINEFLPVISYSFLESLEIIINTDMALTKFIGNIKANEAKCRQGAETSQSLITAFLPYIGYDKASVIIKKFQNQKDNNLRIFLEKELGKDLVDKVLSPYNLTALGYKDYEKNT